MTSLALRAIMCVMGQIRLHISDELHRELKAAAALEGITLQQLVERLLTEGLSNQ